MAEEHGRGRNHGKKQPGQARAEFNRKGLRPDEVELKFLATPSQPGADGRFIFSGIEKYFSDRNWIKLSNKNTHLLTRQLDTPKRELLGQGTTIRIRGDCENDNLKQIRQADICLKTGKSVDDSGALRRGEYEARIADFNKVDIKALLAKYPKKSHPELHDSLKNLKPEDLREYFRIDCYRDRYVVELPEDVTGLKGKRFAAELILDDVAYVMDIPGLPAPLIFHHDLEVECETLLKPCSYDAHPDAAKYVSSPLTRAEIDKAMSKVKEHITLAGNGHLRDNQISKAERGFIALDEAMVALRAFVTANDKGKAPGSLASAFALAANPANETGEPPKLHKSLPKSMAYVLRLRAIALSR